MRTQTHTYTQSKESKTLPHVGHYSFGENIHQSVIFLQPDRQGGWLPDQHCNASLFVRTLTGGPTCLAVTQGSSVLS